MKVSVSGAALIEGFDLALGQARTFLTDAQLLLEAGRYATAGTLPIWAVGEVGKALFIRNMLFDRNIDWPKFWDDFNDHKRKYRAFLNFDGLFKDEKDFDKLIGKPIPRDRLIASGAHIESVGAIVDSRLESLYCHFDEAEDGFIPCKVLEPEITVQVLPWVARGAMMVDFLLLRVRTRRTPS